MKAESLVHPVNFYLLMLDKITHPPIQFQAIKPDPDRPHLKLGVGLMEFSPCGKWLVTRNGTDCLLVYPFRCDEQYFVDF
jgi:hypothetical protein